MNEREKVKELTSHDLEGVNGGILPVFTLTQVIIYTGGLLVAAGTYVLKDIYDNWGDFKEGFADGQNTWSPKTAK